MDERQGRVVVGLDEREGRAGNLEVRPAEMGPDDRPRQRRLAGPDLAMQRDEVAGLEFGPDPDAEGLRGGLIGKDDGLGDRLRHRGGQDGSSSSGGIEAASCCWGFPSAGK